MNIWVADSETDPFKFGRIPKPFLWGAYNGSEYHEFKTTRDFIAFMREQDGICYAHNGGKFDWHFIIDQLPEFSEINVISGRLSKFTIGNCEFRDSYNILPIPLAAYQKDSIDYAIMEKGEREKPQNAKLISDYLRGDCIYLYNLISDFIRDFGLNLTLAGTAMKTWRKMANADAPRTRRDFYHTFAPFYYGGRVECFEPGIVKRPFKVIDINSAYPFAMTHRHPYGDNYNVNSTLPTSDAYIARCFIRLACPSRGLFPYRQSNGSLDFPHDNLWRDYYISGHEFLAAIHSGKLTDYIIKTVYQFNDSIEFGEYVGHFYEQKTQAKSSEDKARYLFAKLLLNSLYGKFGACPENYREFMVVGSQYINAAAADGYGYCAELGPWALCARPLPEHKQTFYNVATAASITGFVRAQLLTALQSVKKPIYCDTDSIVCEDTGDLHISGDALGSWDIEAESELGAFCGKKLYAIKTADGYKTASKGARLTPEEIFKIANGEIIQYDNPAPTMSATAIKKNKNGEINNSRFISRKIRRTGTQTTK